MKLHRVKIQNFKSIPVSGVKIEFHSGFLALVGKNNAGKSNIIEALGLNLGSKSPLYTHFDESVFTRIAHPHWTLGSAVA